MEGYSLERKYKTFEELPSVLTAADLASYLRISQSGAYNLLRSQGFPTMMVGCRMMVQKEKLRTWCEERTEAGYMY